VSEYEGRFALREENEVFCKWVVFCGDNTLELEMAGDGKKEDDREVGDDEEKDEDEGCSETKGSKEE
jgi:hypothetical protein